MEGSGGASGVPGRAYLPGTEMPEGRAAGESSLRENEETMRTSARERSGSRCGRTLWRAVVAGAVLVGGVCPARALTTPASLAKKLAAWGKLRKCQATENGRALQARPADPAKCQTSFDARLATLNALATTAAIPCRYQMNGDGTVTDLDTGLQWEQKTDDGSVHDEENEFDWSPTLGRPDGTAFTTFLGTLNNATSRDGTTSSGCFAGHCDWRLPSIVELRTIVDLTAPGCGDGGACIDQTVFGPTIAFFYWSATTDADFPVFAWGVAFGADGGVSSAIEDATLFVRGARSAL